MTKLWLITEHHFRKGVFQRSFLLLLCSLPLFVGLSVGMGMLATRLRQTSTTLGYVDMPGVMVQALLSQKLVHLQEFDSREEAHSALVSGQLDAYYLLPANYAITHEAELVYFTPPHYRATRHFKDTIQLNLMAGLPPTVSQRVLVGATVTVIATDYGREFPDGGPSARQVLPAIVALMFAFMILTTSSHLVGALVEERENRTIEVLTSSVSSSQLLGGKILAGLGMGVTLLAAWVLFLIVAVWIGRDLLAVEWLQTFSVNWRDILMVAIVALPVQLFYAALMAIIGTYVSAQQDVEQIAPLMFISLLLPIYLLVPVMKNPDGVLAIGATLFPPTSVLTFAMRSIFRAVSTWQVLLSGAISLVSGSVLSWLAARAFRANMLRYGKATSLRELLRGSGGRA